MCERRFDEGGLLVICPDELIVGSHHLPSAVGVNTSGRPHSGRLGLAEGASNENQVVAKGLLQDIVARGVTPDWRRLLVIAGSKALRAAVGAVLGRQNPVPAAARCRHHKIENVMGYLPEHPRGGNVLETPSLFCPLTFNRKSCRQQRFLALSRAG